MSIDVSIPVATLAFTIVLRKHDGEVITNKAKRLYTIDGREGLYECKSRSKSLRIGKLGFEDDYVLAILDGAWFGEFEENEDVVKALAATKLHIDEPDGEQDAENNVAGKQDIKETEAKELKPKNGLKAKDEQGDDEPEH